MSYLLHTCDKLCAQKDHLVLKRIKNLGTLQSTCPLAFGCWELSYVIFLMLRKKEPLAKLCKFTK